MKIENDIELAPRTTLGVGGKASHYARVESESELHEALAWAQSRALAVRVLGGGSNVVVADSGFSGLVIDLLLRGLELQPSGDSLTARVAAGEPWDDFVAEMVARGYQGLECLSGIPGRVGATPIQNVGAYGQDVSETIRSVETFDVAASAARTFSRAECHFSYRDSYFKALKDTRFIVTHVTFQLSPGAAPALKYAELERHFREQRNASPALTEVRSAVLQLRRAKSMLLDASDPNTRSCGSFFVNPVLTPSEFESFSRRAQGTGAVPQFPQADGRVKLSAGWLIEQAGFPRGTREGAVGLSTQHALALVAHDGARASDVWRFSERIQSGVHARFGVHLEPEPVFWGAQPTLT